MDRYQIDLMNNAFNDLDEIYSYVAEEIKDVNAAVKLIKLLEDAIFSLETLPYRGSERKVGKYADMGYRQLFIRNFSVVYRIEEKIKKVIIVTIKYIPREV